MKAIILANPSVQRACHVAKAMKAGIQRHGVDVSLTHDATDIRGDVLIAYGWNNKATFAAYRAAALNFLYIDLGFWLRKTPNMRLDGYHKVVLNDWCPTSTMRRGCPSDRYTALNLPEPLQTTIAKKKIVVAGMSAKSAADHGFSPERWEQDAIVKIATQTRRGIVYRPKPSWDKARPLVGAGYCADGAIESLLPQTHALVTHHSNAAVDAIRAGVPVYCAKGVGSLLSTVDLESIENPRIPPESERMQLLYDIAYLQWNVAEMRDGSCWDNYRGLL